MKKLLVLTAVLALISTSALAASIVGTKHDLSAKNVGVVGGVSTDEICVFCHTPHAALSGSGVGVAIPLKNRAGDGTAFCMSCHDGSVLYSEIGNKSNADTGTAGVNYTFTGAANFGATYDLASNHPVGVGAVFTENTPGFVVTAPSIIASGSAVECTSCHSLHSNLGTPLLTVNNSGSLLCLACHAK